MHALLPLHQESCFHSNFRRYAPYDKIKLRCTNRRIPLLKKTDAPNIMIPRKSLLQRTEYPPNKTEASAEKTEGWKVADSISLSGVLMMAVVGFGCWGLSAWWQGRGVSAEVKRLRERLDVLENNVQALEARINAVPAPVQNQGPILTISRVATGFELEK
ncbi:hypothetical protein B0T20DRAFT_510463 [Sordaria brevicollis]|uniref:Uncharacterized protein n=1 Tax=Sordaria brevicollis TaxID=83679 RepID=A0AAE0P2E7_SORBR|nr:hypothetical protein B0T20DRAFT_510463 [Sordaria brevicollis]